MVLELVGHGGHPLASFVIAYRRFQVFFRKSHFSQGVVGTKIENICRLHIHEVKGA